MCSTSLWKALWNVSTYRCCRCCRWPYHRCQLGQRRGPWRRRLLWQLPHHWAKELWELVLSRHTSQSPEDEDPHLSQTRLQQNMEVNIAMLRGIHIFSNSRGLNFTIIWTIQIVLCKHKTFSGELVCVLNSL